jgi:bifunctional non-homologous end joining protein LigD
MAKKKSKAAASNAVDKQLARYREMRDFTMTAEPSGEAAAKKGSGDALPFVIQKHAATRLHYDFRLGWRGVLKSWAVTKGPSYYPGDKRLAVEVEDHPMDYGGFEGTIPKGQYGGGTVMVWDHGTWVPHVDVDEGLKKGSLKFELKGEKMHGNWALVRMGGRAANESKPNWLLIKEHDEFERAEGDAPITEEAPDSVVTGRDLEEIASAEDHVWHSNRGEGLQPPKQKSAPAKETKAAAKKEVAAAKRREKEEAPKPAEFSGDLKGLPRERLKEFVPPQLALQATDVPEGEDWVHELKLDGYRIQIHVEEHNGRRSAKLYTRNGLDWTHRMPDIARLAARLPVESALLDGEVVVLTESGGTSFAELQAAFQEGAQRHLTYFAFDLLHLNGHNLRGLPLVDRKNLLQTLLQGREDDTLRYSEHLATGGRKLFEQACKLGAEGIVSKLASSKYASGRSSSWVKVKCVRQQELVIGGFTPLKSGSAGIGALLLGYYEGGKLIYAGRTGTGFTQATHKSLLGKLQPLKQAKMPFEAVPRDMLRGVTWVEPKLVAEVAFSTWTSDNLVRQAAFKGLREDKPAKDVRRETAVDVKEVEPKQHARAKHAAAHKAHGAAKGSSASKAGSAAKGNSEVDGVRLTHPDKILDHESELTKRELAEYYEAVAEVLLRHIAGRPLSIVRCPDGSNSPCFFQKHIGQGMPAGIDSVPIADKKGKVEQYITIAKKNGLIGLAQMGVLEIHPWGSRNDALETPDMLIFDLDPDTDLAWPTVTAAAEEVRKVLKKRGLESFVKTTGGKGLHIVVPVEPALQWPEIKMFARAVAEHIEEQNPQRYLTKMTKAARKGKIYIDFLRNERGATAVAPYSPRARSGVGVAMPLAWSELRGKERPQFTVKNFAEWKKRLKRDPWAGMEKVRQSITEQMLIALGLGG